MAAKAGLVKMEFLVPESLHRTIMAEAQRQRGQAHAASATGPDRCGMRIIVSGPDDTPELNCSGKCTWWERLRRKSCRFITVGNTTWCGCS